jgi:WD40 repeat protein
MPPKSKKERPSQAELKVLQSWIDAGAPPFDPPARTTKLLSERDVALAVLADLKQLDPRRHRFTRYLTFSHLAYAGRPEKDLDMTREAAGKLLNSLSWHARLTLPEPLPGETTILRIDLRSYKWNASLWEKLVTGYPYRTGDQAQLRLFSALTGSEVPALRADWFVANASRPPLYHDLLQLPTSDRALERLLQVDVPGDQQEDNIIRAGFNDSGVSKNNRLIERHDAAYGTLWRSYDFSGNSGRQNLFENPLGPNTGATSFQPAGGEYIFHLPNGLQAYMLVDAKGKRIDKGPIEIVADPRRPDQKVETGISCMSCHARGLLPKADQLRGHVEKNAQVFGKQIVETIHATHPRKAQFQAQVEEDNARYLKALEKFGVRDPDQEPVNLVTLKFEGTLDGRTAAAELGLKSEQLGPFLKQHPDLARVFGSLLTAGGTAQRQTFQENFPEMARRVEVFLSLAAVTTKPAVAGVFLGHDRTVNCVAFSFDGKLAASGGDDTTLRIWDVAAGRQIASLKNDTELHTVAFSRDGKLVAGAGSDRVVRLWDVATSKIVRIFDKGHTDTIRCLAFSPDGKRIVTGSDDRSLRIWDVAAGREVGDLAGHTGPISSVAWSQDGKRILSGSLDGTVRYWDWAKQKQLKLLEGHAGPVFSVALSADGKQALSGGNDRTVRIWRLTDGKGLHSFTGHANAVVHVQFAGRGEILSASSQHKNADHTFRRWDLEQRKELTTFAPGAEYSFGCAVFSPDGRHALVGGPGGFLRLWSW